MHVPIPALQSRYLYVCGSRNLNCRLCYISWMALFWEYASSEKIILEDKSQYCIWGVVLNCWCSLTLRETGSKEKVQEATSSTALIPWGYVYFLKTTTRMIIILQAPMLCHSFCIYLISTYMYQGFLYVFLLFFYVKIRFNKVFWPAAKPAPMTLNPKMKTPYI